MLFSLFDINLYFPTVAQGEHKIVYRSVRENKVNQFQMPKACWRSRIKGFLTNYQSVFRWSDQPCYYDWLKHSGTWVCSLILLSKSHKNCWWNRNLFTTFTKTPPFKEVTQNAFPCMKRHKVTVIIYACTELLKVGLIFAVIQSRPVFLNLPRQRIKLKNTMKLCK